MIGRVLLRRGTYRDSITLLRVSKGVEKVPGVVNAAVVMATPLNKRVLTDLGFKGPEVLGAKPDDLVVAIQAKDTSSLEHAFAETERLLQSKETGTSEIGLPRTLSEAIALNPGCNLVTISVPGQYAKREAVTALEAGLNVFMFSSNVEREDEKELKEIAEKKGLLMMGPDCGTAIVNHVVLGFGNSVREGPIGIVSASGTGLQEVSTMVHRHGLGISQALGTGGGDLSDQVGGITTLRSLRLLERDPKTKVIVVISKPPGPRTTAKVMSAISAMKKPVVVNFLGHQVESGRRKVRSVRTLKEASDAACEFAGMLPHRWSSADESKAAYAEAARLAQGQRYVRGLYAGGTLCYEAQVVLSPILGTVFSNAPLDKKAFLEGNARSKGSTCVDLGAEEFVVGRAHPMIDFTLRKMRIVDEARDPEVAVLLLDVELGLGSNPDPAGELAPSIAEAKAIAARGGRYLSVVASIIGTDGDFQSRESQSETLRNAGVIIASSNAGAAELSGLIATRGNPQPRSG